MITKRWWQRLGKGLLERFGVGAVSHLNSLLLGARSLSGKYRASVFRCSRRQEVPLRATVEPTLPARRQSWHVLW